MPPSVNQSTNQSMNFSVPLIDRQDKKDSKSLKDIAKDNLKSNPSALGDPISLKAETSDSEPTEADRPNKSGAARAIQGVPSDKMTKPNPSQLGDHTSLRAETSNSEPTEDDRGAMGPTKRGSGSPKM
jgi:hypothetical protein